MTSLQFGTRWFFRDNLKNTQEFSQQIAEEMTKRGYPAEVLSEKDTEKGDRFIVETKTEHTPNSFETDEYIAMLQALQVPYGSIKVKETGYNHEYNVQIIDAISDLQALIAKYPDIHADKVTPDKLYWDA